MKNKLVYVAGQLVGIVFDENLKTKTLLIRKATQTYTNVFSEEGKYVEEAQIVLGETAMFIDQKDLADINATFVPVKEKLVESVNAIGGRELVFKLLNM